ncbi:MAG: TlyA family RNA methyltransferase [bacterium]|nr:TlyA family RNA methyltransferase [bacterium]
MKKRIDILLTEKGLAESRTKAQAFLMSGQVEVDGRKIDKAGTLVDDDSEIKIKERFPYVSRGALKIQKAYQEFGLDFKDMVICDIGSSTGGFTDFALQNGAKKVFAIDVGYGQLDQKLREDSRVVVMEKTNFRDIDELPEKIDLFVCDVSFISLKKIILKIKEIVDYKTQCVLLIKPQFEVGKEVADKCKGVIKDEEVQRGVVEEIARFAEDNGFQVKGLTESPITGAKGNKEFLIWLTLSCHSELDSESR